jgi:hypothetical protein
MAVAVSVAGTVGVTVMTGKRAVARRARKQSARQRVTFRL